MFCIEKAIRITSRPSQGPDFTAKTDGYIKWQDEESKGALEWDEKVGHGSARASGVKNGCFMQKLRVKEGECYAIKAASLSRGVGEPKLIIRWQRDEDIWT